MFSRTQKLAPHLPRRSALTLCRAGGYHDCGSSFLLKVPRSEGRRWTAFEKPCPPLFSCHEAVRSPARII